MNNEIGKPNPIRLSTQLLYFMDYKIHEYSPEELYENKARLFESLMTEWNNMSTIEQEKYSQKVRFINGGEKAKYRKDEQSSETMYETADEKPTKAVQPIIQEKSESQERSEEKKSEEKIKEQQNNKHVSSLNELKQDQIITYEVISEKEINSQQQPFKSQTSQNQQLIQENDNEQNNLQENIKENNIKIDYLKQDNEIDEQQNYNKGKKSGISQKRSQKGTNDKMKQKDSIIKKRALSLSKQTQLEEQQNQKNFSINETLTLKQLKDQIKNMFKQIE
ncbi:unnamed protein product [Paramecium primaurelia]|uniref:Uncharacterized protein n=1 Tax=Paramecium primaurelia TaxID=5886 RepID=A0A8S1LTA6_PARPR|nr:unnamed protein product [Paramecium primaurelia]